MKTNNILIVALGFLVMALSSCGVNPDKCVGKSKELKSIEFDEKTTQLFPDTEITTELLFENVAGDKISLNEI